MAEKEKKKIKLPEIPWEKLEKLGRTQKILILVVTVAAIGGLFAYLSYMPTTKKITGLKEKLTGLESELVKIKKATADIKAFEKRLIAVKADFAVAQQMLPKTKEIPSLLTNIANLGSDSGLDFLLFKPKKERASGFYAEIPVALKFRADYHSVAVFLDNVSRMERIVTVKDLRMGDRKVSGGKATLTSSCTAVTYKFVEKPKKPKKKKKKKR